MSSLISINEMSIYLYLRGMNVESKHPLTEDIKKLVVRGNKSNVMSINTFSEENAKQLQTLTFSWLQVSKQKA